MKNAATFAIIGAAFALSAAVPAQAQDLAADLAPLDTGTVKLFAPGELDLRTDPAMDAFLASIGLDRSAVIGSPETPETIGDADLDANRGGQTVVVGNQTLDAITSGNIIAGNVIAGAVNVSDSAFSNFNGMGNIAINTGTQVSLQSGINVIINLTQ